MQIGSPTDEAAPFFLIVTKFSRISLKNGLGRGSETDRLYSKATNSEIVKALIVLTQDLSDHNPGLAKPGHLMEADYVVTIDQSNLVCSP